MSIVSYRTPGPLRACLSALAAEGQSLALDVTVVDNASGDGSAEMVDRDYPWVRLVQNATNVGFAAAHNQVLEAARGRYWLVLNSDAAPKPGSLQVLVDHMDANTDVAVAGPKLRYPDGTVQPSRRRFPEIKTLFLESTQIQRFWPHNSVLRRYYVSDRSDVELQDVDWLVGACLCVRAQAARQVGLLDERFFMYDEELDWCRRFRAAGWRISYVPAAEVVHLEGASSGLDLAARDRNFQSSKLAYAAKWHGLQVAAALRVYLILEYVARALEETIKLALGSRQGERRARLRVIGSGLRNAIRW